MAGSNKKNTGKKGKPKTGKQNPSELKSGPWISMRTGLRVIAMTSIAMAILTAYQAIPQKGWLEGILWGLLFGGLIWVVFLGFYFFNRLLNR